MKTSRQPCRSRRQRGSALIIVMILLSLLALFATQNRHTLFNLSQELQRIEASQLERLDGNATARPVVRGE